MTPLPLILVAEDDDDDYLLVVEALQRLSTRVRIERARDGIELLEHLRGQDAGHATGRTVRPRLVLLDLNMPRLGGAATLEQIRSDPALADLDVLVLTTAEGYAELTPEGASSRTHYLTKPMRLPDFRRAVSDAVAPYVAPA